MKAISPASKKDPGKFARFAERIFGIHALSFEKAAEDGIEALKAFFSKIGSPVSLSDANIPESDIDFIAQNATMLAEKWGMEDFTKDAIKDVLLFCR